MNDSETLIITIKHGGLGDHLFYSHLPRLAKETGAYKKVFISNHSDFRNITYKKMIWELNPFVDGFTDEYGPIYESIPTDHSKQNLLDEIMLFYKIDDGKRMHDPELYYKPKIISHLEQKILYDPNYISNAGFVNHNKVSVYFKKNMITPDLQMLVRNNHAIPILPFGFFVQTKSILDFVDLLYSVRDIYCLVTGTATLVSAIGKKANVFYTKDQHPMFRHSTQNNYIQL
jgi:hypothetical protein